MFFPDRITGIAPGQRVLEIGPGAHPFHRSDVLLEMRFEDPEEYKRQFGHGDPLVTDKELVFYDGITFPFGAGEFDYVICSHVLEHVPDVEGFLSEVFRVGRRGYFEYPTIHYEYLYNFPVHLNFLHHDGATLRYMSKADSPLDVFRPVQQDLLKTLDLGHDDLIQAMPMHFIQGFEWNAPFPAQRTRSIEALCAPGFTPPNVEDKPLHKLGVRRMYRELFKAMAAKVIKR